MPKYRQYLVLKVLVLCSLVPYHGCGRSRKSQANPGQNPSSPAAPADRELDDSQEQVSGSGDEAAIADEDSKTIEESAADKSGEEALPAPTEILLLSESVRSFAGKFFGKMEWLDPPSAERENRVVVTIASDTLQTPKSLRIMEIKPWMKIHSHGSGHLVPKWKAVRGEHIFEVENIYFIMSGPWELKLKAEIDGVVDELEFQFEVP